MFKVFFEWFWERGSVVTPFIQDVRFPARRHIITRNVEWFIDAQIGWEHADHRSWGTFKTAEGLN